MACTGIVFYTSYTHFSREAGAHIRVDTPPPQCYQIAKSQSKFHLRFQKKSVSHKPVHSHVMSSIFNILSILFGRTKITISFEEMHSSSLSLYHFTPVNVCLLNTDSLYMLALIKQVPRRRHFERWHVNELTVKYAYTNILDSKCAYGFLVNWFSW